MSKQGTNKNSATKPASTTSMAAVKKAAGGKVDTGNQKTPYPARQGR